MKLVRCIVVFAFAWASLCPAVLAQTPQITANTVFYQGTFQAYDPARGYYEYNFFAFAEPPTGAAVRQVFLLPRITYSQSSIQALRADGSSIGADDTDVPASVRIKLGFENQQPNRSEQVGIAAALISRPITKYQLPAIPPPPPPPPPGVFNDPVQAATMTYMMGLQDQGAAEADVINQRFNFITVAPKNLSIQVLDNNRTLIDRNVSGAVLVKGNLPPLTVGSSVGQAYRARASQGDLSDLLVGFEFQDASVSAVNATFNSQQIVRSYLNDFRQQMSQAGSSGFDFFIISHRDSYVRTRLNEQIQQSAQSVVNSSSEIRMSNATADQVSLFASNFFPDVSQQEAIKDHLSAATAARGRGDTALAKVHEDYAKFLQGQPLAVGVDPVKAAAALASGDLLNFLAAGVRFADDSRSGAYTYNRIQEQNTSLIGNRRWIDVRTVSAIRAVTIAPYSAPVTSIAPFDGLCGYLSGRGLLVTCVGINSPAERAGIRPGDVILKIGKDDCLAIMGQSPCDPLPLTVGQATSYLVWNKGFKQVTPLPGPN